MTGSTLAWGECLATAARVTRPAGDGRFPVALIFHGCGGEEPFLDAYAAAAVEAGWAAVVVDSFKPRGLSKLAAKLTVCTLARLRGAERAGDVFAMLRWLHTQSWARADQVVLAGWSHGGWAVMDAYALGADIARVSGLHDLEPHALSAVKAVFIVYPYAGYPALTAARGWGHWRPKVYGVLAGRDQVVGTTAPPRAFDRLKRAGLAVEARIFAGATHAFDDDRANDPRSRHRPDLFEEARALFSTALRTALD
jgi:dienelactone hydrolase